MKDEFNETYLKILIDDICNKLSKFDFKIVDYDLGKPIEGDDSIFIKKYKFQRPEDTMKFKCGTCWDIACAAYFELKKLNVNPMIIYYESDEESDFPVNHMFLILSRDGKFYSFEASWTKYIGITGPYDRISDIFDEYAKRQILSVKGIETIRFYNVLKFPEYLSNVNSFMSEIKTNPLIYTFTTKKYFKHKKLTRRLSEAPLKTLNEETKNTLHDLIFENEFPSPYFLKDDIRNKIQNTNFIEYLKNDLKKFIDKDWKYFNEFNSLDNSFKLTIIECDENDIELLTNLKNVNVQGQMCEFYDPNNVFHEFIWIKKGIFKNYDDSFLILLNHELGHVWTSVFGFSNNEFTKGRTDFNHKYLPKLIDFNEFQRDVYMTFYNRNYELLLADYDYIIRNDEYENLELTTHADEIIEILVQDYLKYHNEENLDLYISDVFYRLENKSYSFNNFTLLKIYKNKETFDNFNDVTYIRNIIRRLFLLFAFGNKQQIEYFKNLCYEEFKKIII